MKLFIPTIGTHLKLTQDHSFPLVHEYRNLKLLQSIGAVGQHINSYDFYGPSKKTSQYNLPAGTVLAVDRIYIRKGSADFDSLTFRILEAPNPAITGSRFWMRLGDVNQMDADVIEWVKPKAAKAKKPKI